MEIIARGALNNEGFDAALSSRSRRYFRLDLAAAESVNIYGLVGMACAALAAAKGGSEPLIVPPRDPSVSNFLGRTGFDRLLHNLGMPCELPIRSHPADSDVLVEVHAFSDTAGIGSLADLLESRLKPGRSAQAVVALTEALWELSANVVEHSGTQGVVAAQVLAAGRGNEHVDLAIGDAGIGIRESFLRGGRHAPASDHEAIDLGRAYLVTSTADPGRGQGIATTVDQAVGLGGTVLIRTGTAKRIIWGSRGEGGQLQEKSRNSSVTDLRGTIVGVRLPCK